MRCLRCGTRVFVDDCIQKLRDGKLDTAMESTAKLFITGAQDEVMDECLQFFGGYGYMCEIIARTL